VAIGIFSSSLTRSQLVAGMLSFSILFIIIIGVAALNILQLESGSQEYFSDALIAYFQIFDHYEDFSRGLVDTRPFAYYFSGAAAVLGLSILILEAKS
jgi:ABC-2 type transport system permease protein